MPRVALGLFLPSRGRIINHLGSHSTWHPNLSNNAYSLKNEGSENSAREPLQMDSSKNEMEQKWSLQVMSGESARRQGAISFLLVSLKLQTSFHWPLRTCSAWIGA